MLSWSSCFWKKSCPVSPVGPRTSDTGRPGRAARPPSGRYRAGLERRLRDLELRELPVQLRACGRVPAGADVARVLQHAALVVAEQQRADLGDRGLAVDEAADDQLLPLA